MPFEYSVPGWPSRQIAVSQKVDVPAVHIFVQNYHLPRWFVSANLCTFVCLLHSGCGPEGMGMTFGSSFSKGYFCVWFLTNERLITTEFFVNKTENNELSVKKMNNSWKCGIEHCRCCIENVSFWDKNVLAKICKNGPKWSMRFCSPSQDKLGCAANFFHWNSLLA